MKKVNPDATSTGRYEVIVGNLGCVYRGNNPVEARGSYGDYVRMSKAGYGRVAAEPVALFKDGDIRCEHVPAETYNHE